jgi:predicted nucleic acid-binding protein
VAVVVFDNNILSLTVDPRVAVPTDPATGKAITFPKERIDALVARLSRAGDRILIPTPVLWEFLTVAPDKRLPEIARSPHFQIGDFDFRAAIEAAAVLNRDLRRRGGKRQGLTKSWQQIKVDRQIVAIAKVNGAEAIYSTDHDLTKLAKASGIEVVHLVDLEIPAPKTPLFAALPDEDDVPLDEDERDA